MVTEPAFHIGRFAVVDHLRHGPGVPAGCVRTEAFGPLSACVLD